MGALNPPTVSERSPTLCPATIDIAKTSETWKSTSGVWQSVPVFCSLERGHGGPHLVQVAW